jgi:outer membrane protein assembly factor BamE (lipoprotein component of BamABCDE complex)
MDLDIGHSSFDNIVVFPLRQASGCQPKIPHANRLGGKQHVSRLKLSCPVHRLCFFLSRSSINVHFKKGVEIMNHKALKIGWGILVLAAVMTVAGLAGCDRSEPTPAQKTVAPAAAPPSTQSQSPAPAPVAPAVQAPTQALPTAPAPTAAQPAQSPAASQPDVQQNISQVSIGMTSQEVLQLLGNPTKLKQEHQGTTEWEYYTPHGKYEIELQMDRVVKIESH